MVRPIPRFVLTLDGYFIRIKDRIVSSGSITGQNSQPFPLAGQRVGIDVPGARINGLTPYDLVMNAIRASGKSLDPTVLQSGTLSIQTFTNGIDTETWGLELSARQASRLFREELGCTFRAHVANLRIERARRLLAETERSIVDVAGETGWSSLAHFNSAFRRQVGATPSAYRHGARHDPAQARLCPAR